MSALPRQQYTIPELHDMLVARIDHIAQLYAPEAPGAYHDGGDYWTLNPGRADRTVGSFVVHLSGPKAGRWKDFATGEGGDLFDLIRLATGCSMSDAIREGRAILGLQDMSPADLRRREAQAADLRAKREDEARQQADMAERVRRQAQAIWLSAEADLRGTPVWHYLRDARGIDLAALPRMPTAIRYLRECFYQHREVDAETGEVLHDIRARLPAMVATAVDRQGRTVALHRTYLGLSPVTGRWGKADVPVTKKVMGKYSGAAIRVWSGIGPRGGKPGPLAEVAPGTRIYIAEGIEDALSAALAVPAARVLSAISLTNLGRVVLPGNVSEVTLIADQDENPQARAALTDAIEAHRRSGRTVRVWQNRHGGKDLNDRLRQAAEAAEGGIDVAQEES